MSTQLERRECCQTICCLDAISTSCISQRGASYLNINPGITTSAAGNTLSIRVNDFDNWLRGKIDIYLTSSRRAAVSPGKNHVIRCAVHICKCSGLCAFLGVPVHNSNSNSTDNVCRRSNCNLRCAVHRYVRGNNLCCAEPDSWLCTTGDSLSCIQETSTSNDNGVAACCITSMGAVKRSAACRHICNSWRVIVRECISKRGTGISITGHNIDCSAD
ncbi:unannotated protein [freshwater metagenome]|uniref:Unannotated protein n=1 Tax=freshwater metagenome TaxID=449393 RepID=A0A6J5ZM17_9ZZZZ